MAKRDYYDILGVAKDATDDEIKKAYRKLSKKFHPDINKEAGAEDKFKELAEAYEFLSDVNKRAAYDQYGHASTDPNVRACVGCGGGGRVGGRGNGRPTWQAVVHFPAPYPLRCRAAVHDRQVDVHEDDIGGVATRDRVHRLLAVLHQGSAQAELAQQRFDNPLVDHVVLDDQHARLRTRPDRYRPCFAWRRGGHTIGVVAGGTDTRADAKPEARPATRNAVDSGVATHPFGQAAYYRESEPGAAIFPCARTVGLRKWPEQQIVFLGRNANPRIAYRELEHGRVGVACHFDSDRKSGV